MDVGYPKTMERSQQENGKSQTYTSKKGLKRSFKWGQCLKYELNPHEFYNKTHDLPKICTDESVQGTPIQEFYNGAHILVTGATGFMGKILVEKLLVSCPKIAKLYCIIRPKKGKTMEERFEELFNDHVFIRLKKMVPNYREKIEAVSGDCSELKIGISDGDYQRLNNIITHVFHGAATVRFDEKIRTATLINVRGVREMLEFCHKCRHLKSVVHVSTAYANSTLSRPAIDEVFYPAACDYKTLIKLVDAENEDTLAKMTKSLLGPYPNTYAFTKHIAEDVIRNEAGDLPLCIFRPAIVVATYLEPVKAYCDNIYGPTGVAIGVGTGVLRVLHCKKELNANIVPVDTATNGMIAAAWMTAQEHSKREEAMKIYNYVSSERNPMTWGDYDYWNSLYGKKWSTNISIWHPVFFLISNKYLAMLLAFFLQTIPAYIADGLLYMTGQETKLVKVYKKVEKFCDVLGYFCNNSWQFSDKNIQELWQKLDSRDKEIFPFDIYDVNWDYFHHGHCLGLRWYIVKDPIDTIKEGRAKSKRLLAYHMLLCSALGILVLWTFTKIIGWSLKY